MRQFLPLLLLASVIFGCSKPDHSGAYLVKIAPSISTRVTALNFESGDRIGLTITTDAAVYADNAEMIYNGLSFSAVSNLLWYNNISEKSTLIAYYPYNSGGRPAEFSIAADQRIGYMSSDLLVAAKSDVTPSSTPVGMVFRHVMSQLNVILTNNSATSVTGVTISGFIPKAIIDYQAQTASAAALPAADVQAYQVTANAAYRAVLVPQSGSLTVSVQAADGKNRSKTISSATLVSGKRYDMSVEINNIEINVSLSGEIEEWEEGGSLDENGNNGGGETNGNLTYGGVTYTTKTLGGAVWMAESLRYAPAGAVPNSNMWYPVQGNTPVSDAEYVRERGMLYDFDFALGGVTRTTSGDKVQGICPEGWHIPSIEELQTLINSPEYRSDFFSCAGMWDCVEGRYLPNTKGYLMSSTTPDGGSNYRAMVFNSIGGTPTIEIYPAKNGVSVRCVKN